MGRIVILLSLSLLLLFFKGEDVSRVFFVLRYSEGKLARTYPTNEIDEPCRLTRRITNDRRSLRVNRSTDRYWIGIGVRARLGDDARVTRDNDRRADDSVHGVLPRESAADDRSRTISTISHARSNSFAPIRTSRGPFRDHPWCNFRYGTFHVTFLLFSLFSFNP